MSKCHEENPFIFCGERVHYTPAEADENLKGGNSNWRGPVWFPVNWLLLSSLREHALGLPEDFAFSQVRCQVTQPAARKLLR